MNLILWDGENMYVICCYDVKSKHCVKYMKILRKYLFHIQESVFEGELTPKQYKGLRKEIDQIITNEDHIIFFFSYNSKVIKKYELGGLSDQPNYIIG